VAEFRKNSGQTKRGWTAEKGHHFAHGDYKKGHQFFFRKK